jgi:hypothetical protein
MSGFMYIIFMYWGECCVRCDGCMHAFLRVFNLEFLTELWGRCVRDMEGVMNSSLLVIVLLDLEDFKFLERLLRRVLPCGI